MSQSAGSGFSSFASVTGTSLSTCASAAPHTTRPKGTATGRVVTIGGIAATPASERLLRELGGPQCERKEHRQQREQRNLDLPGYLPSPARHHRSHHEPAKRSTGVHARDEHARALVGQAVTEGL